jgi:hypothetical protein
MYELTDAKEVQTEVKDKNGTIHAVAARVGWMRLTESDEPFLYVEGEEVYAPIGISESKGMETERLLAEDYDFLNTAIDALIACY